MKQIVVRLGNGRKTHRAVISPSPHGARFSPNIAVLCGTSGVNRTGVRITILPDNTPITCDICNGSHSH